MPAEPSRPQSEWVRTLNEILVSGDKSLHTPEFLATVTAQNQLNRASKILRQRNKSRTEYLQAIVDYFNALHATPIELEIPIFSMDYLTAFG